jgi:hypothetical protein
MDTIYLILGIGVIVFIFLGQFIFSSDDEKISREREVEFKKMEKEVRIFVTKVILDWAKKKGFIRKYIWDIEEGGHYDQWDWNEHDMKSIKYQIDKIFDEKYRGFNSEEAIKRMLDECKNEILKLDKRNKDFDVLRLNVKRWAKSENFIPKIPNTDSRMIFDDDENDVDEDDGYNIGRVNYVELIVSDNFRIYYSTISLEELFEKCCSDIKKKRKIIL